MTKTQLLEKITNSLKELDYVKFNKIQEEKVMAEAEEMLNKGWEALADKTVIITKNNQVILKEGNKIVCYLMKDFNINMGVLDGNIDKKVKEIEVKEEEKDNHLAQAIITKYYTMRRM